MENDTDQGMRLGVGCEKQTVGSGLFKKIQNKKNKKIQSLGTLGVALQNLLASGGTLERSSIAADNGALRLGRLWDVCEAFMQGVLM